VRVREHQLLVAPARLDAHPVTAVAVTADTRKTMFPFSERLSFDEKIHLLATNGGQFLVADDFVPNGGVGVAPYPKTVAPSAAIEAHMGGNQRKGRIIVLPLDVAQRECSRAHLALHVSNVSIANKPGAEPPIGRLISDYSHPEGASMMFDGKKELNKLFFTPIRNPTAADICQMHANAIVAFPGEVLIAARLDVASAYNRIRIHPPSIPLGALYFIGADGVEYVALPTVEWFGSQDSNFHWQMVTEDCGRRSAYRCMKDAGCLLSGMYTDDYFVIGSAPFVEREASRFVADAMAIVGEDAINGAKTLLGTRIDIIGMSVDLTANHSIGLSSTIYLKLVCAMFVMLDMDVAVGTRVSIKTLQSVASRALRSADVVHVMAAYSRGFSDNLRGVPKGATEVELTRRAFEDLQMWRVTLELGFRDGRWLRVPIRVPLLHRFLPSEDAVQRAHRQAGLADLVVFADACTSHNHGMG